MGSDSFQNSLWRSAEQMELILSNLHTGVLIVDAETHYILEVNKMVCELSGMNKNDILGKTCHEILCTTEQSNCPASLENNDRLTNECVFKCKSGETIPVLRTLTRIELGGRKCLLENIVDLTQQKQVENRLRRERERVEELARVAEEANQAKSEFLANVSHELRTPLNGVIGMAGLLKETTLSEDQECYADTMYTCAESLLKLVNGVLDYSSLETGHMELTKRSFNPTHLVKNVEELAIEPLRKKSLTFSLELDKNTPPTVLGDPSRLQQALMILTDNAIKFTHEGGITIQLRQVNEDDDTSTLRFTVSDTGIGVPDDMHQHVFKRFTQADSSTTRRYGGTGLGLATAKQIIRLMGGKIGLNSRKTGGSEFWFEVQFSKKIEAAAASEPPTGQAPKRILVVDDRPTNMQVLQSMVQRLGYDSESVDDEEAMEMLRKSSFDLVLVDLQTPGMNGVIICKAIRAGLAGEKMEKVPIAAFSAPGVDDEKSWCDAGANFRLQKPISAEKLKAFLEKTFSEETPEIEPAPPPLQQEVRSPEPFEMPTTTTGFIVFNYQKLRNRLSGNDKTLQTVLQGFIGDMPEEIDQLAQLIHAGKVDGAKILAHRMKGASAAICADRISAHCARMEQLADLGNHAALENEVGKLWALYSELKRIIIAQMQ